MYGRCAGCLVVMVSSLLATVCSAQEGVTFTSPRAEALRNFTIMQQGLNSAALNLSDPQKAEIDKILMAYVNEQITLEDRTPADQRKPEQIANARATAQKNLIEALGKVMDSEQRTTWESARHASIELGMAPALR